MAQIQNNCASYHSISDIHKNQLLNIFNYKHCLELTELVISEFSIMSDIMRRLAGVWHESCKNKITLLTLIF